MMKKMNDETGISRAKWRRPLTLAGQCAPFLLTCFAVVSGFIPSMYFHFDATLYPGETGVRGPQSLFGLIGESWGYVRRLANNAGSGQANERMFVVGIAILDILVVLFLLAALFYTGFTAYTALRCYTLPPTSESCNARKRRFRLFVWNRPCCLGAQLLLLPPLVYPYLLRNLYYNNAILNIERISYSGLSFPLVVGICVLLEIGLFFFLPHWERQEHLNLFRYYRKRENEN